MNPLSLMLSFAPWLVLKILSSVPLLPNPVTMLKISICVATAICVYQAYKAEVRGFMFWGTAISFAFNFVAVVLMGNMWVISHLGIISQLLMNAIVWGSIIARRPFTMDYSKRMIPKELWNHPKFLKKNYFISAVWGCYFILGLLISDIRLYDHEINHFILDIVDNGSMVLAVMFTSHMSKKRSVSLEDA